MSISGSKTSSIVVLVRVVAVLVRIVSVLLGRVRSGSSVNSPRDLWNVLRRVSKQANRSAPGKEGTGQWGTEGKRN